MPASGLAPVAVETESIEFLEDESTSTGGLTELAQDITTSVRKRVVRARCDCSLIRHRGLPFLGDGGR